MSNKGAPFLQRLSKPDPSSTLSLRQCVHKVMMAMEHSDGECIGLFDDMEETPKSVPDVPAPPSGDSPKSGDPPQKPQKKDPKPKGKKNASRLGANSKIGLCTSDMPTKAGSLSLEASWSFSNVSTPKNHGCR